VSRLLDTRAGDVRGFLSGQAGPGKHVGGSTESDLRAAADEEPGALGKVLDFGGDVPVVDVAATLAGIAVGTYTDVKGGQPPGPALAGETVADTAGAVTANAAAGAVGEEIGSELGAVGGPAGIAVGALVGYGVGDLTRNLLTEQWGRTRRSTVRSWAPCTGSGTARPRPSTTPASWRPVPATRPSACGTACSSRGR
jgi:hypothetical protein